MDFGMIGFVAITVICYLFAIGVKATPLDSKWIPVICGAIGAALGVSAFMMKIPDFPAHDALSAVAVGIVSGLAATGANQVHKQLKAD